MSANQAGSPVPSLFSTKTKDAGRALLNPVIRTLARAGVSPDTVTVAGLVIVIVGALFIWQGMLLAGAIILGAGAALDAVDGGLARARGGGTRFGAFLDSTLDRTGEAIGYLAIAAYYMDAPQPSTVGVLLAGLALIGSFLVSYTRARAESLGFEASVGLAPRTERIVLVVAGLALAGLGLAPALIVSLGVIAVLTALTVIQRIGHVRRLSNAAAATPSNKE
jgi:CDP-diacylglycerol--glycerol-3-phosphate 3-phosphatidyltransferase